MIRMSVSEDDLGDPRSVDPGILQIVSELACGWLPIRASTGIDQDQV